MEMLLPGSHNLVVRTPGNPYKDAVPASVFPQGFMGSNPIPGEIKHNHGKGKNRDGKSHPAKKSER